MVKRRGLDGTPIGVSLSLHSLCAVIARSDRAQPSIWRAALSPMETDSALQWPSLATALQALKREHPDAGTKLAVALQAPLAEMQIVQLPTLRDEDLQQLLARNAGKYFASARGPQVVGFGPAPREASHRVVAAASARLMAAIHEAAQAAGFVVSAMVPAEAAWAQAAHLWSTQRLDKGEQGSRRVRLLVAHEDRLVLVTGDQLQPAALRRFRAGIADIHDIVDACTGTAATDVRTVLAGLPSARGELSAALTARGVALHVPSLTPSELLNAPDALAASFAKAVSAPVFVTDTVRHERDARARRVAARVGTAAVLLLLLSAAVHLWGVQRELSAVRAERSALRGQLSATLVGRTTIETAFDQLALLAESERTASQWSTVIAGISEQLPLESYLTGFRGRADTVGIDGLALSAARVFDALQAVPQLRGVHASSPVRRETTVDGEALERYQLSALLAPAAGDSTTGKQP